MSKNSNNDDNVRSDRGGRGDRDKRGDNGRTLTSIGGMLTLA